MIVGYGLKRRLLLFDLVRIRNP